MLFNTRIWHFVCGASQVTSIRSIDKIRICIFFFSFRPNRPVALGPATSGPLPHNSLVESWICSCWRSCSVHFDCMQAIYPYLLPGSYRSCSLRGCPSVLTSCLSLSYFCAVDHSYNYCPVSSLTMCYPPGMGSSFNGFGFHRSNSFACGLPLFSRASISSSLSSVTSLDVLIGLRCSVCRDAVFWWALLMDQARSIHMKMLILKGMETDGRDVLACNIETTIKRSRLSYYL